MAGDDTANCELLGFLGKLQDYCVFLAQYYKTNFSSCIFNKKKIHSHEIAQTVRNLTL